VAPHCHEFFPYFPRVAPPSWPTFFLAFPTQFTWILFWSPPPSTFFRFSHSEQCPQAPPTSSLFPNQVSFVHFCSRMVTSSPPSFPYSPSFVTLLALVPSTLKSLLLQSYPLPPNISFFCVALTVTLFLPPSLPSFFHSLKFFRRFTPPPRFPHPWFFILDYFSFFLAPSSPKSN